MMESLFTSLQSLSIHLTSTKGPIDVLLCPDDDSDPKSPVKNGGTDINGNSPFLKVLQGLFLTKLFYEQKHRCSQINLKECLELSAFYMLACWISSRTLSAVVGN